jgi:hypothetical protein
MTHHSPGWTRGEGARFGRDLSLPRHQCEHARASSVSLCGYGPRYEGARSLLKAVCCVTGHAPSWAPSMSRSLADVSDLPRPRGARIGVFGIFFVLGFTLAAWATNLPTLQQRTGINSAVIGLVVLVARVGALCGMQLSGRLTAEWERAPAPHWAW